MESNWLREMTLFYHILLFCFFCLPEIVGLFGAGLLRQMYREEAPLGPPAAAQAVLQTIHAGQTRGRPPVQPLGSKNPPALQEPGDSDQHPWTLVSDASVMLLFGENVGVTKPT